MQLSGQRHGSAVLEALPDKGLAHWHVRLKGTGMLARIPKQSQMALGAQDNLLYQSTCFRRAAPSGHVPRLEAVLVLSEPLPRGALLVEEVIGDPANRQEHLGAIMQALAAIHAMPVPPPPDRAPLLDESDPLAGLVPLIDAQARYLDDSIVPAETARVLKARLQDCDAAHGAPGEALSAAVDHRRRAPGQFSDHVDGQGGAGGSGEAALQLPTARSGTCQSVRVHGLGPRGSFGAVHRRRCAR